MEQQLEQELDLHEIWQLLAKRWPLILLLPLFASIASAIISLFILVPQYQASATLLVVRPAETAQILHQDVLVSRQLVDTYREIARSATVLNQAASRLRLPYSTEELREKVNVTSVRNTEIINISAVDPNPETARDIVNELARVFMTEIVEIYRVENVSLIDQAQKPLYPISPRVQLNVALAFVIGALVAVGLAFLQEYMDKTIKTPEQVQKHLQLPVLGIIPVIED